MTNETQEIEADALRARLAETPADLRGRIYTAAEAQALLDAREAKGAWRVGGVASEGKVWAHDPTALGGPSVEEVCLFFNANLYRPHDGNRALAAAAPDLARTVIAQAAEIATLRAAYAQDLDGLRAELRRADDGRATWRDLRDAAREWARAEDALTAAIVAADGPDTDGAYAAAVTRRNAAHAALRDALAALVGGAS